MRNDNAARYQARTEDSPRGSTEEDTEGMEKKKQEISELNQGLHSLISSDIMRLLYFAFLFFGVSYEK